MILLLALACRDEVGTGSHAFRREESSFVAEVPERALKGRFDPERAEIAIDADRIDARTAAFGRSGALTVVDPVGPVLQRCPDRGLPCERRLEYVRDGLVEWWVASATGFQQGWTILAPPPGAGEVSLHVKVTGATVDVRDGDLWLTGDQGAELRVSDLHARDADDHTLPVRFDKTSGGFFVRVDDTGARYPIDID